MLAGFGSETVLYYETSLVPSAAPTGAPTTAAPIINVPVEVATAAPTTAAPTASPAPTLASRAATEADLRRLLAEAAPGAELRVELAGRVFLEQPLELSPDRGGASALTLVGGALDGGPSLGFSDGAPLISLTGGFTLTLEGGLTVEGGAPARSFSPGGGVEDEDEGFERGGCIRVGSGALLRTRDATLRGCRNDLGDGGAVHLSPNATAALERTTFLG